MRRILHFLACLAGASVAWMPAHSAPTIVASGTYEGNTYDFVYDYFSAASGLKRYTLDLSTPTWVDGGIEQTGSDNYYCDDGDGVLYYCGWYDFFDFDQLVAVSPTRYIVDFAPNVNSSRPWPGAGAGRIDTIWYCCTLSLTTYAQIPGVWTLSYDDVPTGAVPEPAAWLLMLLGFGAVGSAMRKSRLERVPATS